VTPPPLADAAAEGVALAVPGVGVNGEMVGVEEMLTGVVVLTDTMLDNTEGETDTEGVVVEGEALGESDGMIGVDGLAAKLAAEPLTLLMLEGAADCDGVRLGVMLELVEGSIDGH
jgi:hypothetical protein